MTFPIVIESVLRTKVYLTKERWKHIIREHPIVKKYFNELEKTISIPDIIMESNYDNEILLYYKLGLSG